MKQFTPDLIVEVTSVCNRACVGCYAPNIVSNKPAEELMLKNADLFLEESRLLNIVQFWDLERPGVISIRGGEPSLHPRLPEIIWILRILSQEVVIETHGRWLLPGERHNYLDLMKCLKNSGATVKISFDSMHGLKSEMLNEITSYLEDNAISYLIAITESDEDSFKKSRRKCFWIGNDKIIFQKKASVGSDLLQPKIGVINTKGDLVKCLKSKMMFSSINSKLKSVELA